MSRYATRQVLAELESLLTQPAEPTRAEVAAAHGRAIEAMQKVNQRLLNVQQLIAAGRRAEAIELAEGPPHVLDEVAILDTQLIRDWEHWTGQYGLPLLAPLRTDLASQIHHAYTVEKQSEHLLRRHRLLAIGRANLRQRIDALGQLAAADPSNPQWNQALVQYQRRRLEQLARRATQARQFNDLRCLHQILAELRQTRWLTPVSQSQLDSILNHIKLLESREATNEAIAVSQHIEDAYTSTDRKRLAPLIARWRQIEEKIDPQVLAELRPQVSVAVGWFDDKLRQQRIARAQQQALDRVDQISDETTAAEVHAIIQEIASSGAKVPTELRETHRHRVEVQERVRRRKVGSLAATIALVLLLIAAVGLLAFQRYRSEAALAQISADIDQALTYGDLETAAALLKSVPPNDDRFDDFRSQLSEKQAVEQRRVNQFQATVDAIRSDLLAATEEDEFDLLSNRTGKLKQQAVKADELAVAETLADDVESHREQRREEFIQATRELCDQIRADLRTLTLDRNARRSLTQWNLSLQQHRTSRWIRQQSDLQKEIAETSDAVADRWDAIRAGSVK